MTSPGRNGTTHSGSAAHAPELVTDFTDDADESPTAAMERLGIEDAWTYDYWPTRGFAG